jgi:hypothetical protein
MNKYEELNRKWVNGWHFDLEYVLPRVVFHKENSTCYMYNLKDFDEHLKSCGLTNLEYLEGVLFYRENGVQFLEKKLEANRFISKANELILKGDKHHA